MTARDDLQFLEKRISNYSAAMAGRTPSAADDKFLFEMRMNRWAIIGAIEQESRTAVPTTQPQPINSADTQTDPFMRSLKGFSPGPHPAELVDPNAKILIVRGTWGEHG
jgi:hypothetical protein